MQKSSNKIIYSLRIYLELKKLGFKCRGVMPNPKYPWLNCWIYERTPELLGALDKIIGGN